ncbi:lytic transglycosylase [Photobacterium proteolyticum]|uniref:Lytic transglycosylase n=2 Tax=Photobacterium proteolyticum TaxID=1903952 RepID=A0A1Q9GVH0_9GAMM|nr:lytic transglycosylase [Photobacterium proteolyticum]
MLAVLTYPNHSYSTISTANQQHFQSQVNHHYQMLLPHQELINQQFLRFLPTVQQIIGQLEKHQLPKSLVLIPMLESTFNPTVVSPANAAGLWQLMPATAKRFGLNVNERQDERFDVNRSTEAAIAYLRFLYRKFNQDLMLTLAAYNSGEGRVQRAMNQQDKQHFPSLHLPQETINYVHKFYALMNIVDIAGLSRNRLLDAVTMPSNSLDAQQKVLLNELFEIRQVINMKPVPPLISL